ncbi:hypothetical protein [Flagellimonas pacifica]|uniref:Uncharacterized protein n=1 Tax=Flagellimonas pacifica TaxID=1247520 RepID=A0A285MZ61_9FLAO|nr:hypothetical protein [Allomuricauda parva]SNZ01827.1 hypothetical protein SAMN06265377_3674 [Allomuricauda parva]
MTQELIDLFKENYYIPLYLITWIVAVVRYRSYFDTALKYFPIFIIYTFFTELLGYFVKHSDEFQFFSDERYSWHNVIIYNIYSIVTFSFFYYVYWKVLKKEVHKKCLKYGMIISLTSYVISVFFQNPFHNSLYYADLVASITLVMAVVLYFKEKKIEESAFSLTRNLLFWTSLGLLVFYIFFPFIFIAAFDAPDIYYEYNLHQFLLILIAVMYALFIVGFLIGQRKAFR